MDLSGFLFVTGTDLEPAEDNDMATIEHAPTFSVGYRKVSKKPRGILKQVRSPPTWEQRSTQPPAPGYIRLLDPPPYDFTTFFLWYHDKTFGEWMEEIRLAEGTRPLPVEGYADKIKGVFLANQRKRWLARVVLRRWTQRVWRKRTQCNIDLIEMAPVADADAVFLTDTTHRQIYRFHRRDVFANLMSNICLASDMLPTPRPPANPWTNAALTLGQTIGVCQQLVADYGRRHQCPPVLFSAYWAARFDLRRFRQDNSSLLAQYAITSYFKDLHSDNHHVVYETIYNLLSAGMVNFSPAALSKWLRLPQTPLHKEWLAMVRDYTLYENLHVQARPSWTSDLRIYEEAQDLYRRTGLPTSFAAQGIPTVNSLFQSVTLPQDQLMLIQAALFRL